MTSIDRRRVSFLARLSDAAPRFVVLKHLDDFLHGDGDVDATAPRSDLEDLSGHAADIAAAELGATHMIVCDHVPNVRLHFFVQPSSFPQLVEVDIWMQPSRGSAPWAAPKRLAALAEADPHGIRRLRPGAEAVFHLVYKGLRLSGGGPVEGRDGRSVEHGVATDPSGVSDACRTLLPRFAMRPFARLVHAVERGEWDRGQARIALAGFALTGAADPRFAFLQAVHRLRYLAGRECVMFGLMRRHGRTVPDGDLEALLDAVCRDGHRLDELTLRPSGQA